MIDLIIHSGETVIVTENTELRNLTIEGSGKLIWKNGHRVSIYGTLDLTGCTGGIRTVDETTPQTPAPNPHHSPRLL